MKNPLTKIAIAGLALLALAGCSTGSPVTPAPVTPKPSATSTAPSSPEPVETVAPTSYTFDAGSTAVKTPAGETVECPADMNGTYPMSVDVRMNGEKVLDFSCTYPVSEEDAGELNDIVSEVENG
jgi:hypothetical protein